MAELLRVVMELIALLRPWKEVAQWEKGLYYRCGRYLTTVDPGWHRVFPFVNSVHAVSVVPEAFQTPLHSVTLEVDAGKPPVVVTYSATVEIEVEDAALAWNTRGHYLETTLRLVTGHVSESLREEEPERFDTSFKKLERFRTRLVGELDEKTKVYGVRVRSLAFSDFLVGVKAYRFLGDAAHPAKS